MKLNSLNFLHNLSDCLSLQDLPQQMLVIHPVLKFHEIDSEFFEAHYRNDFE